MTSRLITRRTTHMPSRLRHAHAATARRRVTLRRVSDKPVENEQAVKIVIADDHAVVRSGLRMLLDSEAGFEVAAEAGDVDSARRYVRGHHPDVLVLDLN